MEKRKMVALTRTKTSAFCVSFIKRSSKRENAHYNSTTVRRCCYFFTNCVYLLFSLLGKPTKKKAILKYIATAVVAASIKHFRMQTTSRW